MRSSTRRISFGLVACCAAILACVWAGAARAATDTYPAGNGTFAGGPQGWLATEGTCSVALLCTAEGGYDGADGNPPGSPDSTVARAGDATLHLERQFTPGQLVDLAPEVTYTVSVIDRTTGRRTEALPKR